VDYFLAVSEFNRFVSNYIQGYAVEGSFGAHAGGTVPAIKVVRPVVQNVTDWRMVDNLFQVYFATVRQFSLIGFPEQWVQGLIESVHSFVVGETVDDYKLHALHRIRGQSSCRQVCGSMDTGIRKQFQD